MFFIGDESPRSVGAPSAELPKEQCSRKAHPLLKSKFPKPPEAGNQKIAHLVRSTAKVTVSEQTNSEIFFRKEEVKPETTIKPSLLSAQIRRNSWPSLEDDTPSRTLSLSSPPALTHSASSPDTFSSHREKKAPQQTQKAIPRLLAPVKEEVSTDLPIYSFRSSIVGW